MASAGRGPVVLAAMAARVPPAPGGLRGRGTVPRTGRRAGRLSNARRAPPAQVPVRRAILPRAAATRYVAPEMTGRCADDIRNDKYAPRMTSSPDSYTGRHS